MKHTTISAFAVSIFAIALSALPAGAAKTTSLPLQQIDLRKAVQSPTFPIVPGYDSLAFSAKPVIWQQGI